MAVSTNLVETPALIGPEGRQRLLGQRGGVVWLTGLSGSGKSTVARLLEVQLLGEGRLCYVLDGDTIRRGLCGDLGFSPEDRKENIRRVGELAALFADVGIIVLTAFISPYREDRLVARRAAGSRPFLEVHCAADIDACEGRDPKGLYKKARAGQIKDFTGVHEPYEAPESPELVLPTGSTTVEHCVELLRKALADRGLLSAPAPAEVL